MYRIEAYGTQDNTVREFEHMQLSKQGKCQLFLDLRKNSHNARTKKV